MRTRIRTWAGLISIIFASASCTAPFQPGSPIPDTGPTITQVYEAHMTSDMSSNLPAGRLHDASTGLEGYTREVYNELSARFPRLPNPTIVMFVFPHLSAERTPVPGYSTMFQLYSNVEYALPGELPVQ